MYGMFQLVGQLAVVRLGVLILLAGFGMWVYLVLPLQSRADFLEVTIFDVGQGDAVLIETPDGVQVLVDGGPDNTVIRKLSEELGFFDRTLDMVIGTHPDRDHVAGLNDVFRRYKMKTILTTENTGESGAATEYLRLIDSVAADVVYARRGQTFALGASTTLTVLFPDRDPSLMESNSSSIVFRLSYGEIDFLFTGDAPKAVEDYLVNEDAGALTSEVLKLGHHGSDTATSELFLNAVRPQFAVTSAGERNRYGHPHIEVLERVRDRDIMALETLGTGDVKFYADGQSVWVEN